jgi:cob(I)alamin adenosyltransferase
MTNPKDKKSISTRKGDGGETSLFDGTRISKTAARPDVYGTLDEASSFMGLARAKTPLDRVREILLKLQNIIYLMNAELACPPEAKERLSRRLEEKHLTWVDRESAALEKELNLPMKFVLYGETEAGAVLDIARAVMRRAERLLVGLHAQEPLDNPHIRPLVNRLSDTLYLLARLEEKEAGLPFRHPD